MDNLKPDPTVNVLALDAVVFINRGHDIIQRGNVQATTVRTEKKGDGIVLQVKYDIRFPFPAPSRFDEDESDPPYDRVSTYDESQVYLTLQEAFEQKHK